MMYTALFVICAFFLFLAGTLLPHKLLRKLAYWCGVGALAYFVWYYTFTNVIHPHFWLRLNITCITTLIALLAAYIIAYYHQHVLTAYENYILPKILRVLIAIIGFIWLRANIIIWFDPVQQPGLFLARIWGDYDSSTALVRTHFTNMLLTIYYTAYAISVAFASFLFKDKWLWYLSILCACIAFGKILLMIMAMPNIGYRILIFIFIGLLLIIGSFGYQKIGSKEL